MQKELICKWNDVKKRVQDQAKNEQAAKVSIMCKADPSKPNGPSWVSLGRLSRTRFVQNLDGSQSIFKSEENN